MSPLSTAVAVVIAASLLANAWLFNQRDSLMASLAESQAQTSHWTAAASQCDESVAALNTAISAREKAAKAVAARHAAQLAQVERDAYAALASQMKEGEKACPAAQAFLRDKIQGEKK